MDTADMNADTRQTLIGVVGIAVVSGTAVSQGLNGTLTTVALLAIVALISPQALDRLPLGDQS
jgi:hypothetical protein